MGKAKGKRGKGKHVTIDYDSLADVVESSAYKFLTDQEKAQALEEYISVKRQKNGNAPGGTGAKTKKGNGKCEGTENLTDGKGKGKGKEKGKETYLKGKGKGKAKAREMKRTNRKARKAVEKANGLAKKAVAKTGRSRKEMAAKCCCRFVLAIGTELFLE